MTDWIDLTNFGIVCSGLIVAIIGLILTMASPYMEKVSRGFFMEFFPLLIAYIFSDLISQISLVMLGPDKAVLSRAAIFCESLFSSMLMPMLTWYLLKYAGKDPWKSRIMYIACVFLSGYIILLAITQFSTAIYYITEDNIYHRGPLYPVLLLFPALLMLLNLAALLQNRKNLTVRQRQAFAVYIVIPFICMLIQMFLYGLLLIVIGTSVSTLFMLIYIITDHMEQYVNEREENARAQAGIKVLQMRPHFIYNTMTSIYYLCEQNPKKAMETIDNFTNYLRKNFSAIAKNGTIPFKEELEHIMAYLQLQKMRNRGFSFAIESKVTDFKIPRNTLEPLVENAVKYGIRQTMEKGTVILKTRLAGGEILIEIENDGPGFDPETIEDNHSISNIRKRFAILLNGTVDIRSEDGKVGTLVSIHIPVSAEKAAELRKRGQIAEVEKNALSAG